MSSYFEMTCLAISSPPEGDNVADAGVGSGSERVMILDRDGGVKLSFPLVPIPISTDQSPLLGTLSLSQNFLLNSAVFRSRRRGADLLSFLLVFCSTGVEM